MTTLPLTLLIVEDEPVIARRIARLSAEILDVDPRSILQLDTPDAAVERLRSGGIDLLLLDLNLHGEDGFAVLEQVTAFAAQTIIISANTDQAVRAFDHGVLDFVAKPFEPERLRKAFDRYSAPVEADQPRARFLSFRSGRRTRIVPLEDVVLLRGADKYTEVVTQSGEVLLHDRALGKLEQVLPERFERVHKSYIAAMDRIAGLETAPGNISTLILNTGERAPVSRSRIARVRALFQPSRQD